jgi:hypothetical protein
MRMRVNARFVIHVTRNDGSHVDGSVGAESLFHRVLCIAYPAYGEPA